MKTLTPSRGRGRSPRALRSPRAREPSLRRKVMRIHRPSTSLQMEDSAAKMTAKMSPSPRVLREVDPNTAWQGIVGPEEEKDPDEEAKKAARRKKTLDFFKDSPLLDMFPSRGGKLGASSRG